MKKLIFGLVLCLSMAVVAQAGIPIELVNPGFEDPCEGKVNGFDGDMGFSDVPGWEDDATAAWIKSGVDNGLVANPPRTGDYYGFLVDEHTEGENIMWQLTDHTIAAGDVFTLKVWAWEQWVGMSIKLSIFSDDGLGNHTLIAASGPISVPDDKAWVEYSSGDLAVGSVGIGDKLGIAIEHINTIGANYWMSYDDVTLEQALVSNPDPCDDETLVAATTNLEWDLAPAVTNCDVYFGDDPNFINNPKVVDGEVEGKLELYNPPDPLEPETTYYWRVDARVGATLYEGERWEFTTVTAHPIINEDPCGLTIEAGETAVFRVKATGVDYYLWKRADGLTIPGTVNESTLTITDVQKVNEHTYWCELTNGAGTIPTAKVNLMTRRLVALYEFEDDLTDSGTGDWLGDYTDPNTANPDPDPVFVSGGLDGQALQLVADELHVRITDSNDVFNFYPQGYTVNVWVKTEQADEWGTIASKRYRGDSYFGWGLSCDNNNNAVSNLWQVGTATGTSDIVDNEWRMVTATYDGQTGTGAVYVNGLVEDQFVNTNKATINDQPVVFGVDDVFAGAYPYAGLIDKLSIYSYGLSQVDVAVLYTNVMGGNLCVGGNPEYDLDGDCRVNLLDFALLATDWMECNLIPECMP